MCISTLNVFWELISYLIIFVTNCDCKRHRWADDSAKTSQDDYNGLDVAFGFLGIVTLLFCLLIWCCCCSPFAPMCKDRDRSDTPTEEQERPRVRISMIDQPPSYTETVMRTPPPAYVNLGFDRDRPEDMIPVELSGLDASIHINVREMQTLRNAGLHLSVVKDDSSPETVNSVTQDVMLRNSNSDTLRNDANNDDDDDGIHTTVAIT